MRYVFCLFTYSFHFPIVSIPIDASAHVHRTIASAPPTHCVSNIIQALPNSNYLLRFPDGSWIANLQWIADIDLIIGCRRCGSTCYRVSQDSTYRSRNETWSEFRIWTVMARFLMKESKRLTRLGQSFGKSHRFSSKASLYNSRIMISRSIDWCRSGIYKSFIIR